MPTVIERFRAFPVRNQVVLVAVASAAIGAVLIAIWYLALHTSYAPLFANLRPADAGVITAELDRKKIPYLVADGGATILVPDDRVDATRVAVMSQDLPLHGAVGFELFNKSDLGLTDFAQKINYQRALQGELARTIMTLDGVETARVHLAMGEDRLFREDRVPPKASVTIRMRNGARLPARIAQGVQRLVAAAVPKLDTVNVVVLDEAGEAVAASDAAVSAPAAPAVVRTAPVRPRISPAMEFDDLGIPPEFVLSAALFLLFVAGFVLLIRAARRPRRLSESERAQFAARLRAALEQGGEHATEG